MNPVSPSCKLLAFPLNLPILWPERFASYFSWAGPLMMCIVVGYIFIPAGREKLQHFQQVTWTFISWWHSLLHILTTFLAGVECLGGLMLIAGLFTRIAGGALAVVMVVAVILAKHSDIDSVETLFGFEEMSHSAMFFWLAVTGAGKASLDYRTGRRCRNAEVEKAVA